MNILDDIKAIKSTRKELKSFGLVIGGFFAMLGAWASWKRGDWQPGYFAVAAFFAFFGLAWPLLLKPLQKIWMTLALLLGWVMTRVILCALFYLVFTPISLIKKLTGKGFFARGFDRPKASYWIERPGAVRDKTRYENQF